MAEVTKPAALKFARVSPRYTKVRSRHVSPFTLASQSYDWAGETWRFTFELPPLRGSDAAAVITFLHDLAKADNHFVCDVAPYTPSSVGTVSGGARNLDLRLTAPDAAWDVGRAKTFGITFECEIDQ